MAKPDYEALLRDIAIEQNKPEPNTAILLVLYDQLTFDEPLTPEEESLFEFAATGYGTGTVVKDDANNSVNFVGTKWDDSGANTATLHGTTDVTLNVRVLNQISNNEISESVFDPESGVVGLDFEASIEISKTHLLEFNFRLDEEWRNSWTNDIEHTFDGRAILNIPFKDTTTNTVNFNIPLSTLGETNLSDDVFVNRDEKYIEFFIRASQVEAIYTPTGTTVPSGFISSTNDIVASERIYFVDNSTGWSPLVTSELDNTSNTDCQIVYTVDFSANPPKEPLVLSGTFEIPNTNISFTQNRVFTITPDNPAATVIRNFTVGQDYFSVGTENFVQMTLSPLEGGSEYENLQLPTIKTRADL